jgi:bifunctional N-acetylglucosamine-1-phosphate-uridyltransferase/glucosamine-1-phosphate-acetyltransferase GlmU-like protein
MKKDCAVILAAGEGTRMKTDKPKVLAEVLFKPMLNWVIDRASQSGIENICVHHRQRAIWFRRCLNRTFKRRCKPNGSVPGMR